MYVVVTADVPSEALDEFDRMMTKHGLAKSHGCWHQQLDSERSTAKLIIEGSVSDALASARQRTEAPIDYAIMVLDRAPTFVRNLPE